VPASVFIFLADFKEALKLLYYCIFVVIFLNFKDMLHFLVLIEMAFLHLIDNKTHKKTNLKQWNVIKSPSSCVFDKSAQPKRLNCYRFNNGINLLLI
jgi:hypothetical protein